jgi:hypothetical protein
MLAFNVLRTFIRLFGKLESFGGKVYQNWTFTVGDIYMSYIKHSAGGRIVSIHRGLDEVLYDRCIGNNGLRIVK